MLEIMAFSDVYLRQWTALFTTHKNKAVHILHEVPKYNRLEIGTYYYKSVLYEKWKHQISDVSPDIYEYDQTFCSCDKAVYLSFVMM